MRLLKEKFDDRVPLSESVSSSQTSCILATTSGLSLKSMASDLVPGRSLASSGSSLTSAVPEQGESSETPKKTSPTSSVHSPSLGSGDKEERARAVKALLDEGWDFFDQDAELDN